MSDAAKKAAEVTNNIYGRSIVPFTGPFFAVWAFFWPNEFGTWFGTIVHAFRIAGGF